MSPISHENPLTAEDALVLLAMLSARVEVKRGMSERELDHVEERWGFRFAPEHRTLLSAGLPTGSRSWPDWREGDPEDLAERLAWPVDGVLFDVEHNAVWLADWGERPERIDDALRVAREQLEQAPALVPVYGHRYIPADPPQEGNPVLSVHQSDIIVYGPDLATYLEAEFNSSGAAKSHTKPRHIAVWSDLML